MRTATIKPHHLHCSTYPGADFTTHFFADVRVVTWLFYWLVTNSRLTFPPWLPLVLSRQFSPNLILFGEGSATCGKMERLLLVRRVVGAAANVMPVVRFAQTRRCLSTPMAPTRLHRFNSWSKGYRQHFFNIGCAFATSVLAGQLFMNKLKASEVKAERDAAQSVRRRRILLSYEQEEPV
jgi:hypothetical protein